MKKSQRKVYESVIRDIAKIVKQRINESDEEPLFENGEFVEWDSIEDITQEEYYNPELNASFSNINDDYIFYDKNTNQIGFEIKVILVDEKYLESDDESEETQTITIWDDTFGNLIEFLLSSINLTNSLSSNESFFMIKVDSVINRFVSIYKRILNGNEKVDRIESLIEEKYTDKASTCVTVNQFIEVMDELKEDLKRI